MTEKKPAQNPFRPSFGSVPVSLAGRGRLIRDILTGLDNAPGDPNRATILVGARGSGKTALMSAIAAEAEENGWLSVNINAEKDMLEELIGQVRTRGKRLLKKQTLARLSSLQIGGVGISLGNNQEKTTWRSEMTEIISELNNRHTGLLITVDEVSPKYDGLKTLVNCFQHFVREKRDVAILMAGLPGQVSQLIRDDDISYLRRAFRHAMDAIEFSEVLYAMKETVESAGREIETKALYTAAEATGGYAFLIQLIGYHMWRIGDTRKRISSTDVSEGIQLARHDMNHMIFDAMSQEITPREEQFLRAMLPDEQISSISDIANRMHISANSVAQLRRRLLEQGVIESSGRGRVRYGVPFFRDYLMNR